jgi:hypothetical protein
MTDISVLARSCAGKHRYATERDANDVALDCWRKRRVSLRAYACVDGCGGWHLTHQHAPPKMRPGWRAPAPSREAKARERRRKRRRNR